MLALVAALISAASIIVPLESPAGLDSGQDFIVVIFGAAIVLTAVTAFRVWRQPRRWVAGLFVAIATFLVVNGVTFGYGNVDSRSTTAAALAVVSIVAWVAAGMSMRQATATTTS